MAVEEKEILEIKSNLKDIVEINKERKEFAVKLDERVDGAEKKSGELETKLDNAMKDFEVKFTKFEKAIAKQNKPLDIEMSAELKTAKTNLDTFNAIMETKGLPSVDMAKAQEIKSAVHAYHKSGGRIESLTSEQKDLMNTIVGPDGGYLVAPEYNQTIVNKAFDGQGIMELVAKRNIAGNQFVSTIDYADYDDAEYLNELANGDLESHNANYKQVTHNPTEQIYKFLISRSLIEDAMFNVETDVIAKGREGAGRQSSLQVVIGNGVNRPKGILSYADGVGYDKVERVESAGSLKVGWDDILKILPSGLKDPYHTNSSYAMKRATFYGLLADKDGAGQYSIMNQINFFSGDGAGMFFLGSPVKFDYAMGDSTTAGADAVLFGDFSQAYMFVERVGFSLIVDNVTSGQNITYRLRRRNDGRLLMGDALKSLKVKA